ncbi:MAG: PepSY domain-containing protein [Corynebacterium sp.]|nr:PepSY domain-containing protein [Corynebacterium sp.]
MKPHAALHAFTYRLHYLAGVFIAPFIIVAALTGLLYAAAPAAEQLTYRDMLTTSSSGPLHPLSHQVAVAQEKHPDLAVSGIQPAAAGKTTRVLFQDEDLPASTRQVVFVDPVTLDITGESIQYGSSGALPVRTFLSNLHRSLLFGYGMRWYSELAASWLGALALSGTYLWWRRRKARKRSWHSRLGIILLPGMLFLAATGLTWSTVAGNNIAEVRAQLSWMAPQAHTELSEDVTPAAADVHADHDMPTAGTGDMAGIDAVWATARAELDTPFELQAPEAGHAWIAQELRQPWVFSRDSVAIAADGSVHDRVNFADWPLVAKLTDWLIPLHMGLLLGWVNQLALAVLALCIVAMAWLGYRGARRHQRPTRPARFSYWWLAAVVLYGLIAPLFGLSVLVFALLAGAWAGIERRRAGGDKRVAPAEN